MPPILQSQLYSRETSPGVIKVTPIPIETPIHSRPVVQSHPAKVNVALIVPTRPPNTNHFHWGPFLLFVFLTLSLGLVLSKWGWTKITGRIWKWSSGWDGPVVDEDLEELIPEQQSERTSKQGNLQINVVEMQPSDWHLYHTGRTSVEERVGSNPRAT